LLVTTFAACSRDAATSQRLVVVDDRIAVDRNTGLEWTSHDHEQPLNWVQADRYCRELSSSQRPDWRLPEIAELQDLYDPRFDEPCGDRRCHLDPAIHMEGPYVWSATSRGPGDRFYFDFSAGNSFSPGITPTLVRRTICVRAAPSVQRR
jgi:hypothetical protein